MPLRSVIEVGADDSRFKDFAALFSEYQDAAKKMPSALSEVAQHVDPLAAQFAAISAAMLAQFELVHKMNRDEDDLEKKTSRAGQVWGAFATTTRRLMHWVEAAGGVIGLGGLYGLDRLAGAGSTLRTQAMGANASPAQILAARVNWGRFFNAEGAIGNVAGLQQQLGGQIPFSVLGIPGAYNEDPLLGMSDAALAFHRWYKATPAHQRSMMPEWTQARSIFGSDEALRAIGNMSDREVAQHYDQTKKDARGGFGLGAGVLKAAQDVVIELERVSTLIEYTFLAALQPVLPHLEHLSGALGDMVTKFLGSDGLRHGIDVIADGLEHFADWLDQGGVEKITHEFIKLEHQLASFLPGGSGSYTYTQPFSGGGGGAQGSAGGGGGPYGPTGIPGDPSSDDPRGMIPVLVRAALENGLNPDDVIAIARREGLDAPYSHWDVNGPSYGALQMHVGGLADVYQRETGKDSSNPANEADMDTWAIHYGATHGWGPWSSVKSDRAIVPRALLPGQAAEFRTKYALNDVAGVRGTGPMPGLGVYGVNYKLNSRGQPYAPELDHLGADVKAKIAQSMKMPFDVPVGFDPKMQWNDGAGAEGKDVAIGVNLQNRTGQPAKIDVQNQKTAAPAVSGEMQP